MTAIKHSRYSLLCYHKIMKNIFSFACSTISTIFIYVFGGLDVALQCLLVAIVLDYVSGMIKAYESQTLSSRIGLRGIIKKVGLLAIVALGVVIDRLTGNTGDIRTLIIYYFVANEGLSIIENLASAGVPIPAIIAKALKILKDKGE